MLPSTIPLYAKTTDSKHVFCWLWLKGLLIDHQEILEDEQQRQIPKRSIEREGERGRVGEEVNGTWSWRTGGASPGKRR